MDVILLNNPDGAFGYGHCGTLIGSSKSGWHYFSKNGGDSNNTHMFFKTFDQFRKSKESEGYKKAYRVKTSSQQDQDMTDYGMKNYNKGYSVKEKIDRKTCSTVEENCADLSAGIILAGNLNINKPKSKNLFVLGSFTDPNKGFDYFKKHNKGFDVILRFRGNKNES